MAKSTYDINPSVWSKDELSTAFGDTEVDADLETAANYKENLHLSSKSWRRLITSSSPSSYFFPEIELGSLVTDFMEHRQMVVVYGKEEGWAQFILGNTRWA